MNECLLFLNFSHLSHWFGQNVIRAPEPSGKQQVLCSPTPPPSPSFVPMPQTSASHPQWAHRLCPAHTES